MTFETGNIFSKEVFNIVVCIIMLFTTIIHVNLI